MEIETQFNTKETHRIAAVLARTFIQCWDMYPLQLDSGAYICVRKPLTINYIITHLQGKITLGVYLLDHESNARFIVIDADDENQFEQIARMAVSLQCHGLPSYLEQSRRGGHLWLFFEEPIPGKDARQFGKGLIRSHRLPEDIELYPKQDKLGDGPGSLIRLPFGVHRKDGNRYGFIKPTGEKIAPTIQEQIHLLTNPKFVSEAAFDEFWRIGRPEERKPEFTPKESSGDTLSAKVKNAISVYDFVGQYVELTTAERGHCPFHDDQNRSFSVNINKNYWHCFAGCGGGSIIDFWMKYQEVDFTEAVKELASMLLK